MDIELNPSVEVPVAIQAQVLRVLDLSGFTSILKTYPDVQSAIGSYAEQA